MNDATEWFEIEEVAPGVHQLTEGRGVLPCNAFLVADDDAEEALLVDTALGIGDLRAVAEDLAGTDVRVLLTHSHWDHIGAAHRFDDVSIYDRERGPDGTVAIDTLSDEFVARPAQFVADARAVDYEFPDGFDPDAYAIPPASDVSAVAPGDAVTVGERELELIAAPGHSPGQLAAVDAEAGICFGADVVGIANNVYAHFRDCDLDAYRETVETLVDHRDDGAFDVLCTGHNDPFVGDELSILDEIRDGLDDVLGGDAEPTVVDTDWGPARKYEFETFVVLTRA
jgi:glyoxylase-like metal-dependent hydrolase (beta-lactamase superfamily II)